jgi:hypothetical protein
LRRKRPADGNGHPGGKVISLETNKLRTTIGKNSPGHMNELRIAESEPHQINKARGSRAAPRGRADGE